MSLHFLAYALIAILNVVIVSITIYSEITEPTSLNLLFDTYYIGVIFNLIVGVILMYIFVKIARLSKQKSYMQEDDHNRFSTELSEDRFTEFKESIISPVDEII